MANVWRTCGTSRTSAPESIRRIFSVRRLHVENCVIAYRTHLVFVDTVRLVLVEHFEGVCQGKHRGTVLL